MPVRAQLKVLSNDKPDILELINEGHVLRVPKFSDALIPQADYAQLPQRYRDLAHCVDIKVPRFATIVAEGLVPPMKEPGPVNYMIVEKVEGEPLDLVTRASGVPRQQLDNLIGGLAVYLHESAASHVEFLVDIFHLDQFMYGTAESVSNECIWLTDLEPQYLRLPFRPSLLKLFLIQAAELIKSLLYAERYLGQSLSLARHAIEELLSYIEASYLSAASELRDSMHRVGGEGDYSSSAWFRSRPSTS